jgi:hypothetical protein
VGFQGIFVSFLIAALMMIYFYLLIETVAGFMVSYGFPAQDLSMEYFYSQIFLSLGDGAFLFLMLHIVYMFLFGLFLSYILTRHFSIISNLIKDFLADSEDPNIFSRTRFYSKKYVLAQFLDIFFQALKKQQGPVMSLNASSDYLKSFKRFFYEKHVVIEVILFFCIIGGGELYLMYTIHVDLIDGIYNFLVREIVIDNLSAKYITSQINLFTSFSVYLVIFQFILLSLWIFFATRKIMLTNFGYIRVLKGVLINFPLSNQFQFIHRSDDPTLECAKSFEDLLNSSLVRSKNEK